MVVPPVQPDDPNNGVPSDHSIPIATPLTNNTPNRMVQYETKVVQPLPQSGLIDFGQWVTTEKWESVISDKNPNEQVNQFENLLTEKMDMIFPKKTIRMRPFDKPYFTGELKSLDRRKKREYKKRGKSEKYMEIKRKYEAKLKKAAQSYLEKNVRSLKESDPSKYYSTLKRMGSEPGDCKDDST